MSTISSQTYRSSESSRPLSFLAAVNETCGAPGLGRAEQALYHRALRSAWEISEQPGCELADLHGVNDFRAPLSPGSSAPTIMTYDRLPRATQPSTERVPAAG